MLAQALAPFKNPAARRLAIVFAVVYFAQGMWSIPEQPMMFLLKERFGYRAEDVAAAMFVVTIPWMLKPIYGLLSDFVPLFGRRRKSYFVLASGLASVIGFVLAGLPEHSPWTMVGLFTVMGLGLAFTDVLTDALMVENGKALKLTGGFQAVQWASIYTASMIVGVLGGTLTQWQRFHLAFLLASLFPLVSVTTAVLFIHEPKVKRDVTQFRATWKAIRGSIGSRDLWVVAGFIFFFTFSPSVGTPLYFYQTDVLKFGQQFIGMLLSLGSVGAIIGALLYGVLSRVMRLRALINLAIGIGVASSLLYLLYRSPATAIVIDVVTGTASMLATLAFLDLAARACPVKAEGTFFALLMSVYNLGVRGSVYVGGTLYTRLGFPTLILISAAATALCWLLVPLIRIDRIEAKAAADAKREPISA